MFKRKPREPSWKERAIAAEAGIALFEGQIEAFKQELDAIDARVANKPELIALVKQDRKLRFTFMRNGKLTFIEVMSTWDDDLAGWKRALFDPPPPTPETEK